jgi:hypothetical protein
MQFLRTIKDQHVTKTEPPKKVLSSSAIKLDDTAHPLLEAYLHYLRKLNGIHNRIDVLHETIEISREMNYLCKHSFLFFLILTGQFDVLHKLIQAEKDLSQVLVSIKKIKNKLTPKKEHPIHFLSHTLPKTNNKEYSSFNGYSHFH